MNGRNCSLLLLLLELPACSMDWSMAVGDADVSAEADAEADGDIAADGDTDADIDVEPDAADADADVPSTDPLYVGGMLTDGGAPVDGARDLTVRLYAAPSGRSAVCTTAAPGTSVSGGRFRIALDASCATAVHASPDLWMEVQVGTTTFPGRSKVGAVPYALESGRSSEAAGALETRLAAMETRLADLETGPGRTCPAGIVAAGSFCIDKYEASVWSNADCTGTQYGETTTDDYPSSFPDNGNFTIPLYACSITGVMPARMITWFQAQQACAASGKHLCTNEEWQTAVAGTYDPGTWPGSSGACGSASATTPSGSGAASGDEYFGHSGIWRFGFGPDYRKSTLRFRQSPGLRRQTTVALSRIGRSAARRAAGGGGADAVGHLVGPHELLVRGGQR